MILKYNDFYTLIRVLRTISFKNTNLNNFFLTAYFGCVYKYSLVPKQFLASIKNNLVINKYIWSYLHKFYLLYAENSLIKCDKNKKHYVNMYAYINFFNFFCQFLNWYYYFLLFNSTAFIVDNKILKILGININNTDNSRRKLRLFLRRRSCRCIINLDKDLNKRFASLFYKSGFFTIDLSKISNDNSYRYSALELLFLMRNLVIFISYLIL